MFTQKINVNSLDIFVNTERYGAANSKHFFSYMFHLISTKRYKHTDYHVLTEVCVIFLCNHSSF